MRNGQKYTQDHIISSSNTTEPSLKLSSQAPAIIQSICAMFIRHKLIITLLASDTFMLVVKHEAATILEIALVPIYKLQTLRKYNPISRSVDQLLSWSMIWRIKPLVARLRQHPHRAVTYDFHSQANVTLEEIIATGTYFIECRQRKLCPIFLTNHSRK